MSGAQKSQIIGTIGIHVIGPLRVVDADGVDRSPKGMKARGLLALIALSPEMRRPRKWLQARLWSDRGESQGADSLRQCLSEVRRALGDARGCLITKENFVLLDPDRTTIADWPPTAPACDRAEFEQELLEGLEVRDSEFQHWLRDQRTRLEMQSAEATSTIQNKEASEPTSSNITLLQAVTGGDICAQIEADTLIDIIARTTAEFGAIEVRDHRSLPTDMGATSRDGRPTGLLSLETAAARISERTLIRLVASEKPVQAHTIAETIELNAPIGCIAEDVTALEKSVRLADQIIATVDRRSAGSKPHEMAAKLCREGIRRIFQIGGDNYETADRLLAKATELDTSATYLAWRAFIRTIIVAERKSTTRYDLEQEGTDLMRRALELDPQNSLVSALAGHVHSILGRSYAASYEYAEQGVRLNPANALGWAFLGMAKCHLGDTNSGFEDTMKARRIAGNSVYRFVIDGIACVAAVSAQRYVDAVRIGEAGHLRAPEFAAPIRHLTVLYHHLGDHEAAERMVRKMLVLEPDFSFERMRDENYPAASLRRTPLLDQLPKPWV